MGRLIADKYKEWEAECNERFNTLKANEEELNVSLLIFTDCRTSLPRKLKIKTLR